MRQERPMIEPGKKLKIRRQPVRRRRRQSAWIAFEGERSDHQCEVFDVSHAGARIASEIVAEVGSRLGITLIPKNPKRPCVVVWCRGKTMGVKFVT